ncbi:MAG TPA: hypothetical protein VEI83_17300 [Acidimicrobiales bacterium]|nr:hypothetical protein [Acidimicrobiales bacterium]
MGALRAVAVAAGVVIVLYDLTDLVRALIVPRPYTGGIVALTTRALRRLGERIAMSRRDYETRDRALAVVEPVIMVVRLGLWVAIGFLGFALLLWGVGHRPFVHALVESGSSLTTLGFANEPGTVSAAVSFLAAAFGLVVIALQIAYLPALYEAFNRREVLVTMLESRAGTPAWGPELLARHYLVGIEGNLAELYSEWERWSADVAESHTTYPILLRLRSPHATNSWVVALVSVLDSAALYLALCPRLAPAEARLCVRMGFTCLRDIARVIRIPFDPDPRPDAPIELGYDDFLDAVRRLERAGVPLERTPEAAWPEFRGWRVNYESVAYALADLVYATAAPWTGPRTAHVEAVVSPLRPTHRSPEQPEGDPVARA